MSRNILITNPTLHPKAAQTLVGLGFHVFVAQDSSQDSLISIINQKEIVGLFVRIEKITKKVFDSCPSLKIVVENGIGVDNIDVKAASENGVMVANLSYGALAVAEHTLALLLALARDIVRCNRDAKAGLWLSFDQPTFRSVQISGKNLLIVGAGNIGRQVAKRAAGLDVHIKGYDPFMSTEVMATFGMEKADDLDSALQWADFICIHIPLSDATKGMFSTREFGLMKRSAYIINVSRGPIIDEKALVDALKNGDIAGAGIDVFDQEPTQPDNPLFALDNTIVSAHVAGTNATLMENLAILGAQSIAEAIDQEGKYGLQVVNKAQLKTKA